MRKPWLDCILLETFSRRVGSASRTAQKQLEKSEGKKAFSQVFKAADLLLLEVRNALSSIDPDVHGGSEGAAKTLAAFDKVSANSLADSDAPWPPSVEAPAEQPAAETSSLSTPCSDDTGPVQDSVCMSATSDEINALVEDRVNCIRPHLEQELCREVGIPSFLEAGSGSTKRVRDVAAHIRKRDALIKISSLNESELKQIQRGRRRTKPSEQCAEQKSGDQKTDRQLDDRVAALEVSVQHVLNLLHEASDQSDALKASRASGDAGMLLSH